MAGLLTTDQQAKSFDEISDATIQELIRVLQERRPKVSRYHERVSDQVAGTRLATIVDVDIVV